MERFRERDSLAQTGKGWYREAMYDENKAKNVHTNLST
jgi:hypothetical protein